MALVINSCALRAFMALLRTLPAVKWTLMDCTNIDETSGWVQVSFCLPQAESLTGVAKLPRCLLDGYLL